LASYLLKKTHAHTEKHPNKVCVHSYTEKSDLIIVFEDGAKSRLFFSHTSILPESSDCVFLAFFRQKVMTPWTEHSSKCLWCKHISFRFSHKHSRQPFIL